jgi:hypothetical protein
MWQEVGLLPQRHGAIDARHDVGMMGCLLCWDHHDVVHVCSSDVPGARGWGDSRHGLRRAGRVKLHVDSCCSLNGGCIGCHIRL